MDSNHSTGDFLKRVNDFLAPDTDRLVISYVTYTSRELGFESWLAISGLDHKNEGELRESLVSLLNNTGLTCLDAPIDSVVNALIKTIRHAKTVPRGKEIVQFVCRKSEIMAAHESLEKRPIRGTPTFYCVLIRAKGNQRSEFFRKVESEDSQPNALTTGSSKSSGAKRSTTHVQHPPSQGSAQNSTQNSTGNFSSAASLKTMPFAGVTRTGRPNFRYGDVIFGHSQVLEACHSALHDDEEIADFYKLCLPNRCKQGQTMIGICKYICGITTNSQRNNTQI